MNEDDTNHTEGGHVCDDDCVAGIGVDVNGIMRHITRGELREMNEKKNMQQDDVALRRRKFVRRVVEDEELLDGMCLMLSDIIDPDHNERRMGEDLPTAIHSAAMYFYGTFRGAQLARYKLDEWDEQEEEAMLKLLDTKEDEADG